MRRFSLCMLLGVLACAPEEYYFDGEDMPRFVDPNVEGPRNVSIAVGKEIAVTPLDDFCPESCEEINTHAGLTSRSHLSFLRDTYVIIDAEKAGDSPLYPRFTKTAQGEYLMFYHRANSSSNVGNECYYLRSFDAVNWTYDRKLFVPYKMYDQLGTYNTRVYAGAFPVTLPNGDILVVASTRMIAHYKDTPEDNGLAIKISSDGGNTWTDDIIVNVGTNWEPLALVLPDGKIQVYYTDGDHINPHVVPGNSNGSGTAMIESSDGGRTWTPSGREHHHALRTVRVSNERGTLYTDQMPAVIKLNGSDRLAAATESNRSKTSRAEYWISFAYSESDGSWGEPNEAGELPASRNNFVFKGAAPYLSIFPSGETVLTYNSGYFNISVGDENCRGFDQGKRAFEEARGGTGYWGSSFRIDTHRILAAVGGSGNIQMGQYYLNHAINATTMTPKLDGDQSEWKDNDEALYLAASGISKGSLRASVSPDSLYFLVERTDRVLSESKYSDIYIAAPNEKELSSTSMRIRISKNGIASLCRYNGDTWQEVRIGARAYVGYKQLVGYVAEVAIPRKELPESDGMLLLNFALTGQVNDSVIPVGESTEKWVPLMGLYMSE